MRHGSQIAPDGSPVGSHEIARCEACQSELYDVPVRLDGIPVGRVAMRCPHCDDKRPLDAAAKARQWSEQLHRAEHEAEREYRLAHIAKMQRARERRDQTSDPETRAQCIAALQAWYREHGRTPTYYEMGSGGPILVPGLPSRMLTRRLFGSIRDMVVAAGLPVRSSGRQLSEDAA